MTKILYIGTTKEASGWGEAARGDLQALSEGFDVVTRPMVYSGKIDSFKELESKSLDHITSVIQYCLPEQWRRYGTMKHIGYMEVESNNLQMSRMSDFFNMVDEIWVPNEDAVKVIKKVYSGEVVCIPHAIDTSVYKKSYNSLNIPEISGTFKFFCTSENVPRKNLLGLISAYWSEFDPTEPVSLILKTNGSIFKEIPELKKKMRLYDKDVYQKVVVITDNLTQDQMLGLYQDCGCYVNPSMGESWGLPIVHAVGFNKPVISPMMGGPRTILSKYNKFSRCEVSEELCEGHNNGLAGFQTGFDFWFKPVVESLKLEMRYFYQCKNDEKETSNCLEGFNNEKFVERVGARLT